MGVAVTNAKVKALKVAIASERRASDGAKKAVKGWLKSRTRTKAKEVKNAKQRIKAAVATTKKAKKAAKAAIAKAKKAVAVKTLTSNADKSSKVSKAVRIHAHKRIKAHTLKQIQALTLKMDAHIRKLKQNLLAQQRYVKAKLAKTMASLKQQGATPQAIQAAKHKAMRKTQQAQQHHAKAVEKTRSYVKAQTKKTLLNAKEAEKKAVAIATETLSLLKTDAAATCAAHKAAHLRSCTAQRQRAAGICAKGMSECGKAKKYADAWCVKSKNHSLRLCTKEWQEAKLAAATATTNAAEAAMAGF